MRRAARTMFIWSALGWSLVIVFALLVIGLPHLLAGVDEDKPVGEVFRCVEIYKRDFGAWPKDFTQVLSRINGLEKGYFESLQRDGGLSISLQCQPLKKGTASVSVVVLSRGKSDVYTRILEEAGPKESDPFSDNPVVRPQFRSPRFAGQD